MNRNSLLAKNVYGFEHDIKSHYMLKNLNKLTSYHYKSCTEYARIIDAFDFEMDAKKLENIAMIPVRLFKHYALKSIPDDKVIKTLTSSGTTSQQVSKIFLDKETSTFQTKILVKIMQNYLGKQRLPMLIVDTAAILKNRKLFSARGAGILGLSNFGRDHTYLLNESMELDVNLLKSFLYKHNGGPILMFGFTFMVWQYLYMQLKSCDETFDLSRVILIHSGGWKKLEEIAVDNTTFKTSFKKLCGMQHIHNFYGMVEQVGSIFVECECGYLHTPSSADIIIRDPQTFEPLLLGQEGLIQVLSLIPTSYPGHSLLSEDIGTIWGEDDCACGKKGKYFTVKGRLEKSEVRGCSDTYAVQRSSE